MSNQSNNVCPNCNAEIKKSVFGSENWLVEGLNVEFINRFTANTSPKYCTKCSKDLLQQAYKEFVQERTKTIEVKNSGSARVKELINYIPIVTLHNPFDWKYESIQIVSSQSVTGTGVITEIASNWTDFFGMESGRYNEKLKNGEEKCKNMLRLQALQMGGNAILGTDIDYSEAGAGKGMLMVCMAGTAVKITNLSELKYNSEAIQELESLMENINKADSVLNEFSKYEVFTPQGN